LTQSPAQLVRPLWQLRAHAPLVQTLPAGQTAPQAPQLLVSDSRLVQVPLQSLRPAWHVNPHWPLEQTLPVGHALAQVPQLPSSVWRSTQRPLQLVCPTGHVFASTAPSPPLASTPLASTPASIWPASSCPTTSSAASFGVVVSGAASWPASSLPSTDASPGMGTMVPSVPHPASTMARVSSHTSRPRSTIVDQGAVQAPRGSIIASPFDPPRGPSQHTRTVPWPIARPCIRVR
jgi:hypothetical protein